jgi:hypothetical protein
MRSKTPPSANRDLWLILFFIIPWGFVAWLFPLNAWGQSIEIVNTDTQQVVGQLHQHDVVALPMHVNLKYNPATQPSSFQSVRTYLDAQWRQPGIAEGAAPYSVFGDVGGKFNAGSVGVGKHVVDAMCFPRWDQQVSPVERYIVEFEAVNPPVAAPLPVSPVASNTTVNLLAGGGYVVAKPWGDARFNGSGFTLDGHGATITCTWHTTAPLFNFSTGARDITLRNFTVDLGDPSFRTPLIKLGGTHVTLENITIKGGGDVIQLNSAGTRGVTIRGCTQLTSYAGNWLYGDNGTAALAAHEDLLVEANQVLAPIWIDDHSLSHVCRLYGLKNARIRGNTFLNDRARAEGAALRIHTTRGNTLTIVENNTLRGFENRIGPLPFRLIAGGAIITSRAGQAALTIQS